MPEMLKSVQLFKIRLKTCKHWWKSFKNPDEKFFGSRKMKCWESFETRFAKVWGPCELFSGGKRSFKVCVVVRDRRKSPLFFAPGCKFVEFDWCPPGACCVQLHWRSTRRSMRSNTRHLAQDIFINFFHPRIAWTMDRWMDRRTDGRMVEWIVFERLFTLQITPFPNLIWMKYRWAWDIRAVKKKERTKKQKKMYISVNIID